MASAADDRTVPLQRFLISTAIASGGWPYHHGKSARIEPTSWALVALRDTWSHSVESWQAFAAPHIAFLGRAQRSSGFLTDHPDLPPNLGANAATAWTLAVLEHRTPLPELRVLQRALVSLKGVPVPSTDSRQDNTLRGWPWFPETFSWVEPTALCLLALKTGAVSSGDARARIAEAERLLQNRCCDDGGWNYGNASALGQDLRPHVPPTALALLALQDRPELSCVSRSVELLRHQGDREESGYALGLSLLALHAYGKDVSALMSRLITASETTQALGNVHAAAVALLALSVHRHDGRSFFLRP